MKLKKSAFFAVLALSIAAVIIGCESIPELGKPTELQEILNAFPPVEVGGKTVKFDFGGDVWISKVDGKNYMAGTFKSEDTADGSVIPLTLTHTYSSEQKPGIGGDVGWVSMSGPDIVLEYKKGPPESLTAK